MSALYKLGGNVFFLIAYSLFFLPNVYLGIRYRTWGFSFGVLSGLFLEIHGYVARVVMSQRNDDAGADGQDTYYVMYLVCLTIGPAFFSASIYLCLARIITVYGQHLSYLRPRTITLIFIFADVGSLLLQASGGALTTSMDPSTINTGMDVLRAGLGVHLAAIAIYVALSSQFAYSVWSKKGRWNHIFFELQSSTRFKTFLIALAVATMVILIRTTYRVVEFSTGTRSDIADNETLFFVLEGTMVLIAVIALTVFHPGISFQGRWPEADFQFRTKSKEDTASVEIFQTQEMVVEGNA